MKCYNNNKVLVLLLHLNFQLITRYLQKLKSALNSSGLEKRCGMWGSFEED